MAFVDISPAYREHLGQCGLADADRLLALPAVIVSGHPDRNVAQVTLGTGPAAVHAFLKREHRVAWKDRLASAWAGFGLASRCHREFQVLQAVQAAGIGCPEPIAAGEDSQGRAFVLVRELAGALDLRFYLRDGMAGGPDERRRFARRFGEALARVHDAGFAHPDLNAKHVLVDRPGGTIRFLDWQRSGRRRFLTWPQRWRDLASLDATLADELATDRERLTCLLAYLRATAQWRVPRFFWADAVRRIRRHSLRLQRRRRIREQRQAPLATGAQNLIWLEGEALCVTREFQEEMRQAADDWLTRLRQDLADPRPSAGAEPRIALHPAEVSLPGPRRAHLVRRSAARPLRWLWSVLRHRPLTSPELERAATLFRLQRFGVATPRLLAVGQRHPRPWRTESFLLTEPPAGAVSLAGWLAGQAGRPLGSAERRQRRRLLREAGQVLRRLHHAGYHGSRFGDGHFLIQAAGDGPTVVLGSLEGIHGRRYSRSAWHLRDLRALYATFTPVLGSRTDALRFLLGYLGARRLTPEGRRLVRKVVTTLGKAVLSP